MKQLFILLFALTSFISCVVEEPNGEFTYKLYNDSDHAFVLYGYDENGNKVFDSAAKENQGIFFEKTLQGSRGDSRSSYIYYNYSETMKLVFDDGKILEYGFTDDINSMNNILSFVAYSQVGNTLEYHFTEEDYQLAK